MWECGKEQTDTQTRVTTIHFASSATHVKCNNNSVGGYDDSFNGPVLEACTASKLIVTGTIFCASTVAVKQQA